MDKQYLEKQKQAIEDKIKTLKEEIKDKSKVEDIGSADDDNATEFEQMEENYAINTSMTKEVENLEDALKRIEDGTYGICEVCSQPIEKSRLDIYPEARLCATHAQNK